MSGTIGQVLAKQLNPSPRRKMLRTGLIEVGNGDSPVAEILVTAYTNPIILEKFVYVGEETCDASVGDAGKLQFGIAKVGDTLDVDGLGLYTMAKTHAIHAQQAILGTDLTGALAATYKTSPREYPNHIIVPSGYSVWLTPVKQSQSGENAGAIRLFTYFWERDELKTG